MQAGSYAGSTTGSAPFEKMASFFPARVMTPTEVREALQNRPPVEQSWTEGKWYLCGDVQTQLFLLANAQFGSRMKERITAYSTPVGGHYAVISHQVLGWCHRFLLPLYEPKVMALLTGLRTQKLGFSLGNAGGEGAVLVSSNFNAAAFAPLVPMARALPDGQLKRVFRELPKVINSMNDPGQIPSMVEGIDIVDVSVSVVMPASAIMKIFDEVCGTETV
jgi:hypothetical protein